MEQKIPEQKSLGGVIERPDPQGVPPRDEDTEPSTEKARRFIFTYFPKDDNDLWDPTAMKYMYYGEEEYPTTKRKHHQGWFITHNPRSERAMCKTYACRIRIMRGTYKHNWKYCGKDGKTKEYGEQPQQGQRNDLTTLKELITTKQKTPDDIAMESPHLFHQFGRTLERVQDITLRKTWRTEKTTCVWYVSPTRCGKSHKAYENYTPDTHYNWVDDKGWWDNYRQQDTVIIDDFRGQIPYNILLRLTDKWPFDVPRRNRPPMPFTSKHIIITSSMTPAEVYHNLHERDSLKQLMRRITVETIWKNT